MIRRLGFLVLTVTLTMVTPTFAFAASKEIMDLQRDVAILQDLVKQIQQSQDRQFAAIGELVRQSLDAANKANTAVAVIQSGFQQNGNQLKNEVVGPVVGLSTRMDQVTNAVGAMQTAISDLTSEINKIQAQLTDVGNAVKILSAPPIQPPQQAVQSGGGSTPATDGASSAPPVNANDLYNNAQADRQSGKLDFAAQEYTQYLKYYGNTNFAPFAQFYIGSIHYSEKNYDAAVADFDTVVEKYPVTQPITSQAQWYKGKSLVGLGKRTAAGQEFREVIKNYPGSDAAIEACGDLKELGMNCPSPAKAQVRHKD